MVTGLDIFREHFSGFEDRYVLIGGTATYLALDELGEDFRQTKDLDIVLCLEALDETFAQKVWDFIGDGQYQIKEKSSGKGNFYRFVKPITEGYPYMLELFSRVPDTIELKDSSQNLTPIPTHESVSSLSAILLDEDYYHFIHTKKRELEGISFVGAECLIPLKAKAYVDLRQRKDGGEKVDSRDIKKHKNDVFRLFNILDQGEEVALPPSVRKDLEEALAILETDKVDLKAMGVMGLDQGEVLAQIGKIFGLA